MKEEEQREDALFPIALWRAANNPEYPDGVIAIYKLNEEVADPYTVYYNGTNSDEEPYYGCLAMGPMPFHPQGFCQHSWGELGFHNGELIRFRDLPDDCQKAVLMDLGEEQ